MHRPLTKPLVSTLPLRAQTERPGPRPRWGRSYRGADLAGLAWRGASLEGCDFRDADLRGADLRGADLFGARFHGTDLRRTLLDMNRIVEVWIPRDLPLPIVNQIRQFDFRHVMARYVGPNRAHDPLDCPYGDAAMKPILYEWGSRTWNQGAGWNPPEDDWDLEEIIGAVLDHLACRHDLRRPYPTSSSTTARDA